jgi:hypothetical protein
MSSLDTVNRFLFENADYATITETLVSNSTTNTDAVASLKNNAVASN